MGIFSGSTKTLVASSVYNLAGDINERPNYMKTTVMSNILMTSGFSMGDTITNSYMSGPGIRMRLFSNWSKDHFDPEIGAAYGELNTVANIPGDIVAGELPPPTGYVTFVQSARIGYADYQEWCDQYLMENYPLRFNESFEIDIADDGKITMTPTNGGANITFYPANFEQGKLYLYADFTYYKSPHSNPPEPGDVVVYNTEAELPSKLLWSTVSEISTPQSTNLNKRVETTSVYSDGRPNDHTIEDTPSVYNWNIYENTYRRGFNTTMPDGTVIIDNRVMIQKKFGNVVSNSGTVTNVVDIGGGVTRTDTIVTTTESVKIQYSNQYISNKTSATSLGQPHMLIYKHQSGNPTLDALFDTKATDARFYPFIPIRENKRWIDENYPDLYPLTKRAFKKATGGKLQEVYKQLRVNDKIDDIQFIYGTFGVSLNSVEDTAKEYIYRFYQMATEAFPVDPNYPTMESVIAGFEAANQAAIFYVGWWDKANIGIIGPNVPQPPEYPVIPNRSFRVHSNKDFTYDMDISWNFSFESTGIGQGWPGAKKGKLNTRYAGTVELAQKAMYNTKGKLEYVDKTYQLEEFEIIWQDGKDTWRKLRIFGLKHKNRAYDKNYVFITAKQAMEDDEESGFIIPLHTNIYRAMSLTHSTQMSTACTYLVLNSYQKVKEKWYQTGWFKVVIVVVAVVIAVYSGGAGAGILGTYSSVGAALGFAGLAAIIVGAIANVLAAMILIAIIQKVSTSLFGDKIGFIVAAIASFVAMNVGTAMSTGASMSTMMGNMMSAPNLLQLTTAVGDGINKYVNASTLDMLKQTEQTLAQYHSDMKEVQTRYNEMFGTGGMGVIDPMNLTEYSSLSESMDSFLSRTLLTGSEISGMSLDMITNFAEMTLTTDFNAQM